MYDVSREGVAFTIQKGNPLTVRFKSPFRSGFPEVDDAWAVFFEVKTARRAVVFVHGLARTGIEQQAFYPRELSRHGIAALMPILPFHENRISPAHEYAGMFLEGPSEVMEKKFYQAVTDVLTCVDFLEKAGYGRVGIMGISSGGMIATIAMALDERITKGVLIITGGNLEIISSKSIMTRNYRTWKRSEHRRMQERSLRIRREFDECARSFVSLSNLARFRSFFRYDPSLFAKMVHRERVLMFTALVDPFIPRAASDDLWCRFGKPRRFFLPSGHLTAHILFKRFILRKSLAFFMSE
jgi:dienelactone hydrolase